MAAESNLQLSAADKELLIKSIEKEFPRAPLPEQIVPDDFIDNCFNYSSACSCKDNDAQPCGALRQPIENVLEHACGGMSKTTFFRACSHGVYLVESFRSSATSSGW